MRWIGRLFSGKDAATGGFLMRLARARGGNTLALMAAALIPLIGFSGSAVDMARLYVVKVRLQQACDAGVLAGRKTMTNTDPSTTALDPAANTQAQAFFNNNFRSGWFRNTGAVFTPIKVTQGTSAVANAVYGTAQATVPMALIQFFGAPAVTVNVSCQALYDLADADIMFVLDTTGSMSCYPTDPSSCATSSAPYQRGDRTTGYRSPEKSPTTYNGQPLYSKIESLRQAVVSFDSTMRANADPSTHVRYGFVAYSSSVNVGAAIPNGYLQNTDWTYQSRHLSPAVGAGGKLPGDYGYGNATNVSLTGVPQALCVEQRSPVSGFAKTGYTWTDQGYYQAARYYDLTWTSANGGTCSGKGQPLRPLWRYEPVSWSLAQYTAGSDSIVNPTRLDGSVSSKWRGCVEELDTSASASFSLNNLPADLNPDVTPSGNNRWRPIWPDVEWLRSPGTASQDVKDEQVNENVINEFSDYNYRPGGQLDQGGSTACGMPVKRLKVMTAQEVRNYVYDTDFQPVGGTYHDVGMIWGTRMLSPKSVFADSTSWPGRNEPTRTIVFMTDGTMSPSQLSYGQYGVEALDNRVGSSGNSSDQYSRHVARFRIECDAAKKKGFTVYTIAVGLHGTAVPDLDYCSSQGQAYYADDTQTLKNVFTTIAQRVAKLRISR